MSIEFTNVQSAFTFDGTYKSQKIRLDFVRSKDKFWTIKATISPTRLQVVTTLHLHEDECALANIVLLLEEIVKKHERVLSGLEKEVIK